MLSQGSERALALLPGLRLAFWKRRGTNGKGYWKKPLPLLRESAVLLQQNHMAKLVLGSTTEWRELKDSWIRRSPDYSKKRGLGNGQRVPRRARDLHLQERHH